MLSELNIFQTLNEFNYGDTFGIGTSEPPYFFPNGKLQFRDFE